MLTESPFRPAWWLANPHAQTLWHSLARRRHPVPVRPERLELPDGDFLDLAWTEGTSGPIVVILHGLEGSLRSAYAGALLAAIHARGWRGCFMHFRNCSDEPNRLPRSYHSGETGDPAHVFEVLRRREPHTPIAVVGFSLGGNALLKYLGQSGADAPLAAGVAVSVPLLLWRCADRLEGGFSRLYQWHLLRRLKASYRAKFRTMDGAPFPLARLGELKSFREFDDAITAPLHGFQGVDHYYRTASSRQYLRGIRVPTLIIHALDDPFMTEDVVPQAHELPPGVTLELSRHGGHVGFVAGRWPWRPRYWLDERIPAYLAAHLE
jgi:predicted alpha/beta-fold hydrolase